jgi:dihydrofolate reductase
MLSEGVNEGFFEADSLEDVLYLCEHEEKVFIIGGTSVFKQTLNKADSLYITWIHAEFTADTFFPEINFSDWKEVSREDYEADEKNPYPYSFVEYQRIAN